MKLNLGCGYDRREGFVNVDSQAECAPDQVVDLEQLPWPWPDGSVEAVLFHHSLEHLGGDPKVFLGLMQELYRVCAPGAVIEIVVPHPRSDNFLGDPTHVRPISPQVMQLFDRQLNDEWKANRVSNTPLAHYLGVDFAITKARAVLDEPYSGQMKAGELSGEAANLLMRTQNNIASEWRIEMVVRK